MGGEVGSYCQLGMMMRYIRVIQPDSSISIDARRVVEFIWRVERGFERITGKESKSGILIDDNVVTKGRSYG